MANSLRFKANGSALSGTEILGAFLSHKEIRKLLDQTLEHPEVGSRAARRLAVDHAIVERLVVAVGALKNSTCSLHDWHAYSAILTAIAPDSTKSFDFDATLKARE